MKALERRLLTIVALTVAVSAYEGAAAFGPFRHEIFDEISLDGTWEMAYQP